MKSSELRAKLLELENEYGDMNICLNYAGDLTKISIEDSEWYKDDPSGKLSPWDYNVPIKFIRLLCGE